MNKIDNKRLEELEERLEKLEAWMHQHEQYQDAHKI